MCAPSFKGAFGRPGAGWAMRLIRTAAAQAESGDSARLDGPWSLSPGARPCARGGRRIWKDKSVAAARGPQRGSDTIDDDEANVEKCRLARMRSVDAPPRLSLFGPTYSVRRWTNRPTLTSVLSLRKTP